MKLSDHAVQPYYLKIKKTVTGRNRLIINTIWDKIKDNIANITFTLILRNLYN